MSQPIEPIQLALGDPRFVRTIAWFVGAGALCYLAAIFWFGWRETVGAFTALDGRTLLIGAALASTAYLWRFGTPRRFVWNPTLIVDGRSRAR